MKQTYTALDALYDISVECDELGMMPTIPTVKDYDKHFVDVFKHQFDIIEKSLKQFESIKKYLNEELPKAYEEYSRECYNDKLTPMTKEFYSGMRQSILATINDLNMLLGVDVNEMLKEQVK